MKTNKTCREIERSFSTYVNGEETAEEKARIDRHLNTCASCTRAFKEMQASVAWLGEAFPKQKAEAGQWERLARRIRAEQRVEVRRSRVELRVAAGLIVFLGAACLLWLVIINDQVVEAIRAFLEPRGIELSWLLEGPLSAIAAPLMFLCLCSLMTLVLSPILLRKEKQRAESKQRLAREKLSEGQS